MNIAVWRSEYETGHNEVDEEHRTLFKLINNLENAISQGSDPKVLKQLLNQLINETAIHFENEEELVKPVGYGNYFTHKAKHSYLEEVLIGISEDFEEDSSILTLEVVQSILDLVVRHICEEDIMMIQFFLNHQDSDDLVEVVPPLTVSQLFGD